jgi:hypothetical protein
MCIKRSRAIHKNIVLKSQLMHTYDPPIAPRLNHPFFFGFEYPFFIVCRFLSSMFSSSLSSWQDLDVSKSASIEARNQGFSTSTRRKISPKTTNYCTTTLSLRTVSTTSNRPDQPRGKTTVSPAAQRRAVPSGLVTKKTPSST